MSSKKQRIEKPVNQAGNESENTSANNTASKQRITTSKESIAALIIATNNLEMAVNQVESPDFKKSLLLTLVNLQKKVKGAAAKIDSREKLALVRKAISEGKEIVIKE